MPAAPPEAEWTDGRLPPLFVSGIAEVVRAELLAQRRELMACFATESDHMSKSVSNAVTSTLIHIITGIQSPSECNHRTASEQNLSTSQSATSDAENKFQLQGVEKCVVGKSPHAENDGREGWRLESSDAEQSGASGSKDSGRSSRQKEESIDAERRISQLKDLSARKKHEDWNKLTMREKLRSYLRSPVGEYTVALLIIVNAAMFGVQADYSIAHPKNDAPKYFQTIEWFFTAAFSLELSLRLIAYGRSFFSYSNPDFTWNYLDFFLVVFSYSETLLQSTQAPNLSSARLVRLLRLLRIVRVLRVLRFFQEMRIMVLGIISSLKPLFWALMLLTLIIYMFAIVLLQLIESDLAEMRELRHFSSLLRLMYTLYMCISGGISWIEVVDPMQHINPLIAPLFATYVAFSIFCCLNIVTGFFVDQSSKITQEDEETMLINELETRQKWMKDVESVFEKADEDASGVITFAEFAQSIEDVKVSTALKHAGIDLHKTDPANVWELLDFDGAGSIEITEFTRGLQKIHGDAKSIDIAKLQHECHKIDRRLNEITQLCTQAFSNTQNSVAKPVPANVLEIAEAAKRNVGRELATLRSVPRETAEGPSGHESQATVRAHSGWSI